MEDFKENDSALISHFSSFLRPDPNRDKIFKYKYSINANKHVKLEPNLPEEKKQMNTNPNYSAIDGEANNSKSVDKKEDDTQFNSGLPMELIQFKEKVPLFIFINLKNDSSSEIQKLKDTLTSIESNLTLLSSETGINPKNILLFIFMENILEIKNIHYLLPGLSDDQISLEEESKRQIFNCNTLFYDFTYNNGEQILKDSLNIVCVFKKDISLFEAQKVFLLGFCNELKKPSAIVFFPLFLENGIIVERSALYKMILALSYSESSIQNFTMNDNKIFGVRGCIESISNQFGIYSSAQQYEYFHTNTFDLPFKDCSSRCDLTNKFSMLKINPTIMNMLADYYNYNTDTDINFHNELLPHELIYSNQNTEDGFTLYLPDCEANINNSQAGFADVMEDYSNKLSANMHMFFTLIVSLFTFKNCSKRKVAYAFINILNIFSSLVNFVLPGLFIFVIYSIFFEAFELGHYKAVFFFTVLYAMFILITSYFSITSNNPQDISILFVILHYIFLVFYIFILICAVVAIDKVRTLPDLTYTWDTGAFVAIIIINIALGITPIVLNFGNYKKHLTNQLFYLLGGASSCSSLFIIYSIFNVYKNNKSMQRSLFITGFLFCNLFFGYLIFTLDSRGQRINSILNLAIIFTLYNSFKTSFLIFNYIKYYLFTRKSFEGLRENVKYAISLTYQSGTNVDRRNNYQAPLKENISDNQKLNNRSNTVSANPLLEKEQPRIPDPIGKRINRYKIDDENKNLKIDLEQVNYGEVNNRMNSLENRKKENKEIIVNLPNQDEIEIEIDAI